MTSRHTLCGIILVFCLVLSTGAQAKEPLPAKVSWVQVSSEYDFWTELYSQEKVFVMFSSSWCSPCKTAKAWWETQPRPAGWKFVYWQITDPEELKSRFGHLASQFMQRGKATLPLAAAVIGAKDGALIRDVSKGRFVSYEEVTTGALRWVKTH